MLRTQSPFPQVACSSGSHGQTSAAGARSEKEELREDGAFVDDREQEDQWQTLIFSELTERCKVVQHLNQLLTDQKCQLMEMVAALRAEQAKSAKEKLELEEAVSDAEARAEEWQRAGEARGELCVACCERPSRMLLLPCGHCTLCRPCFQKLSPCDACPTCRGSLRGHFALW